MTYFSSVSTEIMQRTASCDQGSEPERPEPHNFVGARAGAGAILFFLQKPEHFKKIGMEPELESELAKISAAPSSMIFKNEFFLLSCRLKS